MGGRSRRGAGGGRAPREIDQVRDDVAALGIDLAVLFVDEVSVRDWVRCGYPLVLKDTVGAISFEEARFLDVSFFCVFYMVLQKCSKK